MEANISKGYLSACRVAAQGLSGSDGAQTAIRTGATWDSAARGVILRFLGKDYFISWYDFTIKAVQTGQDASLSTSVLLLNYLLDASPRQPTGDLIAFRDIPGAATYDYSFQKRAVKPLIKAFDRNEKKLLAAAHSLGGRACDTGDVGIVVPVLPFIEVTYAIWNTSDEFPATAVILFDSSVRRMLSIECMVVAASNCVYELARLATAP